MVVDFVLVANELRVVDVVARLEQPLGDDLFGKRIKSK